MKTKTIDPVFFVLILLCAFFVLVTAPIPYYFNYNEKRIFQLGILLSLAILALVNRQTRIKLQQQLLAFSKPSQAGLAAIAFLAILSSFQAENLLESFRGLFLYLGLFILLLGVAHMHVQYSKLFEQLMLASLVLSAFLFEAAFFSVYFGALLHTSSIAFPEPFAGFENYRFFNQYQVGSIFLLALPLMLYRNLPSILRSLIYLVNIGWWIILLYLKGRGSIGVAVLAPVVTWLFFGKRALPFVSLYFKLAVAGFAAYAILFHLIPLSLDFQFLEGGRPDPITQAGSRPAIWSSAIEYARSAPLLGIGLGTTHYYSYIVAHPHNSLLQWAAEMGLPSTVILLALTGTALLSWIQAIRHREVTVNHESESTNMALFATISGLLGYSLVSGVIVMPVAQTILIVIAGWMIGTFRQQQFIQITDSNIGNGILILLLSSMLVSGFLITLPSDIAQIVSDAGQGDNLVVAGPKFWVGVGIK